MNAIELPGLYNELFSRTEHEIYSDETSVDKINKNNTYGRSLPVYLTSKNSVIRNTYQQEYR